MTTATAPSPATTHEHGWVTLSSHATSDGIVRYVRCAVCGALRVDHDPQVLPPLPLTPSFRAAAWHRSATMRA